MAPQIRCAHVIMSALKLKAALFSHERLDLVVHLTYSSLTEIELEEYMHVAAEIFQEV